MKKIFVLIAAVCMTYTTAFAQTVKPFKAVSYTHLTLPTTPYV